MGAAGSRSLVWTKAVPGPVPPPPHPLLVVAEGGSDAPAAPTSGGLGAAIVGLRRHWISRRPERLGPATPSAAVPLDPRHWGRPAVLVVGGGPGGGGRTQLALEAASFLARGGERRVLLVDADPVHPDLDLRLSSGGSSVRLGGAGALDGLLLRLAEVARDGAALDRMLQPIPGSPARALLAPAPEAAEIGPEQLDYLLTYVLAAHFDSVVVDAGPLAAEASGVHEQPWRFWLQQAGLLLVPTRPGAAGPRAAERALAAAAAAGVARSRCRVVFTVGRDERQCATESQRRLAQVSSCRWPWSPPSMRRAERQERRLWESDAGNRRALALVLEGVPGAVGPQVQAARPLAARTWRRRHLNGAERGREQTTERIREMVDGIEAAVRSGDDLEMCRFLAPPALGLLLSRAASERARGRVWSAARSELAWCQSRRPPDSPGRFWLRLRLQDRSRSASGDDVEATAPETVELQVELDSSGAPWRLCRAVRVFDF
ncbi:MAG: hypothetical protein ACREN7_06305 [Candidatus Dormibacteria bacterium]